MFLVFTKTCQFVFSEEISIWNQILESGFIKCHVIDLMILIMKYLASTSFVLLKTKPWPQEDEVFTKMIEFENRG